MFLCQSAFGVEFFLRFDATDLPLDVWAVEGVDEDELVEAPEGFIYVPRPISPQQLTLVRRDESPGDSGAPSSSAVYASTLTITLDDGTVLHDEDARDWARQASRDDA